MTSHMTRWILLICFSVLHLNTHAVEIYGHRGAAGLAPENTKEAIATGLALGSDVVDIDVVLTKDNEVVAYHYLNLHPDIVKDEHGQWLSDEGEAIKNLTYEQLQRYDVGGVQPGSASFREFPLQRPMGPIRIAKLEELIQFAKLVKPEVRFQIEIKTNPEDPLNSATPEQFVPHLVEVLEQNGVVNDTEVHSIDWRNLVLLRELAPDVTLSYISIDGHHNTQSTVWTANHYLSDQHPTIPDLVKSLGGKVWCPQHDDLTKENIKRAKELGLKITTWSVDNPKDMLRMMELGVDGIITNRPDLLQGLKVALKIGQQKQARTQPQS